MALSITSITRENGTTCDHIVVTVDDEGTSRTFRASFMEVDKLIDDLGGPLQAKRTLVLLWAAYRRSKGRAAVFSALDPSTEVA
jgi:hypothetical protein